MRRSNYKVGDADNEGTIFFALKNIKSAGGGFVRMGSFLY